MVEATCGRAEHALTNGSTNHLPLFYTGHSLCACLHSHHLDWAAVPPAQKVPMESLDTILRKATASLPPPERLPRTGRPHHSRKYAVDLLKTDTEGYDVVALTGAPQTLASARFVLWECHIKMATTSGPGTSHAGAAAALAAAGFESYKLSPQTILRFDGKWYDWRLDKGRYMGWHNCLAVRRDDPLRRPLLSALNGLPECSVPWGLDPVKAQRAVGRP